MHYNPIPDYSKEYLTFVAKESGTFTFAPQDSNVISYSTDNGTTWTEGNSVSVNSGDKVLWKGIMTPSTSSPYGIGKFSSTANFDVQGNVMSLLYGDNYKGQTDLTGKDYAFYKLFDGNTKVVNAENLSFPATTLAGYCYYNMFYNCTNLTTAPELPATTLAPYCYGSMFNSCKSLVNIPSNYLPSTSLKEYCYTSMFMNCTSLVSLPDLPATTLATYCYSGMFSGCKSLVSIPSGYFKNRTANGCYVSMFKGCTSLTEVQKLPATSVAQSAYMNMFMDCTSLATVPSDMLPATSLSQQSYDSMFQGCTSLKNAPAIPATRLGYSSCQYMFFGCSSLVDVPSILPATTLQNACYNLMFQDCISLTVAPELPAINLTTNCYKQMFKGCAKLTRIKAMFTTTPSNSYTRDWVNGVPSTGTFIKNSSATWNVRGTNGIPNGWTVETASA